MDAALRDWQYEMRGDIKVPIHGGPGELGLFNVITTAWVPGEGYPDVVHGSSFIQVASFDEDGCPDVRTILTY